MIKKNISSYTYYDILQLPSYSKEKEIKSAKEKRMAELRFKLINEAYNHLKNPVTRSEYNKQIKKNNNKIKMVAVNDNPSKKNILQNIITNSWHSLTEIIWPTTQSAKKGNINHG